MREDYFFLWLHTSVRNMILHTDLMKYEPCLPLRVSVGNCGAAYMAFYFPWETAMTEAG